MSKRIMLLTLAVAGAALFALTAIATANENHIEGATGKAFTGTGAGGSLTAEGEPTITCTSTVASGSFTSETTGTVNMTFTGCKATILGVSLGCRSGSTAETITVEQVFHLITIGTISKAGILLTPPFPEIICGSGISQRIFEIRGNGVIGTVTSPSCGASSKSMTFSFTATTGSQEHKLFTGVVYDLTNTTAAGTPRTAGITGSFTTSFNDGVSRKLVCT